MNGFRSIAQRPWSAGPERRRGKAGEKIAKRWSIDQWVQYMDGKLIYIAMAAFPASSFFFSCISRILTASKQQLGLVFINKLQKWQTRLMERTAWSV
jgi:hypothetical protein